MSCNGPPNTTKILLLGFKSRRGKNKNLTALKSNSVRLSEWCCSVSMVWVQIPSREEQKFDSSKI
jgi:hypothetical protein